MEACLQLIGPLLSSRRNIAVIEVGSRWRIEIKLKGGDDLRDLLGKVLALVPHRSVEMGGEEGYVMSRDTGAGVVEEGTSCSSDGASGGSGGSGG